jgi:HEAT repeat protein
LLSGDPARDAIRVGVRHGNADVRMYCAKALDHLIDEESFPELVSLLDDCDDRVRVDALHALACDRCKDTLCRPEKADVLPKAITLLRSDPSARVRQAACEVIGRWVHTDVEAERALLEARDLDAHSSVGKKASWYAPGGTIHQKTRPRLGVHH